MKVDVHRHRSPPDNLSVPSVIVHIFSTFFFSFALSLRAWIFDAAEISEVLKCLRPKYLLSKFPCLQCISKEDAKQHFLTKLVES